MTDSWPGLFLPGYRVRRCCALVLLLQQEQGERKRDDEHRHRTTGSASVQDASAALTVFTLWDYN